MSHKVFFPPGQRFQCCCIWTQVTGVRHQMYVWQTQSESLHKSMTLTQTSIFLDKVWNMLKMDVKVIVGSCCQRDSVVTVTHSPHGVVTEVWVRDFVRSCRLRSQQLWGCEFWLGIGCLAIEYFSHVDFISFTLSQSGFYSALWPA